MWWGDCVGDFKFITDESSNQFCLEIAEYMVHNFEIRLDEAIGRINEKWGHLPSIVDSIVIPHFEPEEWAYMIYYGVDENWKIGEDNKHIKPLPYPKNK
jgi:hypothetical protein